MVGEGVWGKEGEGCGPLRYSDLNTVRGERRGGRSEGEGEGRGEGNGEGRGEEEGR